MKRLIAILGMVAMLSPAAALADSPQTTIPNGVARIGAANSTDVPLDFSDVGVAIIDTGIDLSNTDLNVVGGVDCTEATDQYASSNVRIEGAQRSVWDRLPGYKEPVPDGPTSVAPVPEATTKTDDKGNISFTDLKFQIATINNPAYMGGARPNAEGYEDGNGHGTHVAGIVGAIDNDQGVVGVAPNASLYSVRVLDGSGGGSLQNLICGLDWVAANADRVQVANMSLGADAGKVVMDVVEDCDAEASTVPYVKTTEKLSDELHDAVCRITDAGVVLVAAAGNGWGDAATIMPGGYPEVITVSNFADFDGVPGGLAVDEDPDPDVHTAMGCPDMGGTDDQFWTHLNGSPGLGFGSFGGPVVDLAAPGVCVFSTFPGGFASLTGTSMATPHVVGAAVRIVADNPQWLDEGIRGELPERVREALLTAAELQTPAFRDSDEWHEPILRVEE